MRGGILPAALLCAALGLALAFASRRAIAPSLALLVVAALAAVSLDLTGSKEIAFAGCWASVIVLALSVYLPRGLPTWAAVALALDAGLWAGSVLRWEAAPADLIRALPLVLVCFPASLVVARGWQIAIRVVSSWLIAIALLCALLPTAATPGYVPDHME